MSSVQTIDVAGLVSQLMAVERQPIDLLTARQTTFKKKADALDSLKNLVSDVATKAGVIDLASEWNLLKASSSSSAVSTAVTSGGFSGSLSFTVGDLATSQKLYSASTVTSTSAKVTTASRLLLAAGGAKVGFSQLTGSSNLGVGEHKIEVTQSSAAAVKTGPWPTSKITIDNTSDELVVELNGMEYHVTIPSGTDMDHATTADALNTAFANAGIGDKLTASTTSTGELQLATTGEGSANSIKVTGGSALPALGLSVDATAITGTDGKVKVDGVETVLTDVRAGATASLASTTGSVNVTYAGGVRAGTLSTRNVDLGDGSLSAVVNAINGSGGDVQATAIKVGDNAYRFQVQSKLSGVEGRMNVDLSAFDGISSFATLSAGSDASINIVGDNPLTVTSSSNTFADVLPGVSFTINSKTADTVTVTATKDQDTLATRIQQMVDSVNKVITDIKTKTAYDATAKTGGVLNGDYTISRLQQTLRAAVTDAVAGGDLSQAGQVGITLNKDGTLAFDKAKFQSAYAANPDAVQRVFVTPPGETTNKGITTRLADVVKSATDFTSGTLSTAAQTRRDMVTELGKQINAWEDRLTIKQATLMTQFTNLNTALSNLGNQSQWLAGQIAGLA